MPYLLFMYMIVWGTYIELCEEANYMCIYMCYKMFADIALRIHHSLSISLHTHFVQRRLQWLPIYRQLSSLGFLSFLDGLFARTNLLILLVYSLSLWYSLLNYRLFSFRRRPDKYSLLIRVKLLLIGFEHRITTLVKDSDIMIKFYLV